MLPELKTTQGHFAELPGVSRVSVAKLLNERLSLSPELAPRLEHLPGPTVESWLRMHEAVDWREDRQRPGRFTGVKRLSVAASVWRCAI